MPALCLLCATCGVLILPWGQAILTFVNQKLEKLGLSVQNLDSQVGTQQRGSPQGVPGREGPQGQQGRRVPCVVGGAPTLGHLASLLTQWESQGLVTGAHVAAWACLLACAVGRLRFAPRAVVGTDIAHSE